MFWYSNSLFVGYVLSTRPTIQISDHCIRKQDRVHLSDIEMASKNQTIWHLTFFWPTKYWGIKVKTLGLSSRWLSKLRYLSRVVLKLLKLDPHCSGNLKSGLVWISNGQKELVCKWSGFWKRSEIGKPEPLKSGHMTSILSAIWNLDKNVWILNDPFLNGWDHCYSSWKTKPLEIWSSKKVLSGFQTTIQQPDMIEQFEYQACPVFRWLLEKENMWPSHFWQLKAPLYHS